MHRGKFFTSDPVGISKWSQDCKKIFYSNHWLRSKTFTSTWENVVVRVAKTSFCSLWQVPCFLAYWVVHKGWKFLSLLLLTRYLWGHKIYLQENTHTINKCKSWGHARKRIGHKQLRYRGPSLFWQSLLPKNLPLFEEFWAEKTPTWEVMRGLLFAYLLQETYVVNSC